MIDHFASRVDAADTRTRVHAFAVPARTILKAIGTDGALGAATGRGPDKRGQTRTDRLAV